MIDRLRVGAVVAILGAACTSAEPPPSTGTPIDVPVEAVTVIPPHADPMPQWLPPLEAIEHRVRGKVAGGFVVARQAVRVAEPVILAFEVHSTDGPMTVFMGGDQRNAAYFPTRVGVKVQGVDGAVVCDSVAAPAIPSFGGPGGDRTLQQGELLRESFVLNPMCPALADPGVYRVTLHRRITSMAMIIDVKGVPTSCDVSPVHEDAPLVGLPDRCAEIMRAVPSVTTTFELEVLPYDRAEVETAIADAYARADAASPKDEILKNRLDAWLRGWVKCDGASLPEVAPPTLAMGCVQRTVR